MYPYLITDRGVTVYIKGRPHNVNKDNANFNAVVDAIKAGKWDEVETNINKATLVINWSSGNISVTDKGTMLWKEQIEVPMFVANRVIQMREEGFNVEPLSNFIDNLMQNPTESAREELFQFMESGNMPVTPDGYFLAYKKVRFDFKDIYTGTMDNSPGQVLTMPREDVDANRNRTCSKGLHFCSFDYLSSFASNNASTDRVVVVKVNPADVVAIPTDYNFTKGRTWKYEVLSEIDLTTDERDKIFGKSVTSYGSSYCGCFEDNSEDEYEDEYEDELYEDEDDDDWSEDDLSAEAEGDYESQHFEPAYESVDPYSDMTDNLTAHKEAYEPTVTSPSCASEQNQECPVIKQVYTIVNPMETIDGPIEGISYPTIEEQLAQATNSVTIIPIREESTITQQPTPEETFEAPFKTLSEAFENGVNALDGVTIPSTLEQGESYLAKVGVLKNSPLHMAWMSGFKIALIKKGWM